MHKDTTGLNAYDATAATVGLASFMQYLPSIAAVLSIIWFLIRIAESDTVQQMLGKYRWIKGDRQHGTSED